MVKIQTPDAPAAIGPYSQGYIAGGFVYTSGQLGLDPVTGNFAGSDIVAQTEQACKNICALLAAAGTSAENVIKTTCFLSEIADFSAFNAVYAKYFTGAPARSCVAVKDLPKGGLCEIEVIAEL